MKNKPKILELFEGCFGKQRNGYIVGPLTYTDDGTGHITNGPSEWSLTGRFTYEESQEDIIEIIPAPEKLPEPFECIGRFVDGTFYQMNSDAALIASRSEVSSNVFELILCKVTPIERVK